MAADDGAIEEIPEKIIEYYEEDEIDSDYDSEAEDGIDDSKKIKSEKWMLGDKLHRIDGPALVRYNKHGNVKFEEYYVNGEYREDGPAVIGFYLSGEIRFEEYYSKDIDNDEPTRIEYSRKGSIIVKEWEVNGKYHRKDGPAVIRYYSSHGVLKILGEYYFIDGKSHREDGPADFSYYGNGIIAIEGYSIDGKSHREDGPADIKYFKNGKIHMATYMVDDKYHRLDGPAHIEYYENGQILEEDYYVNDELHRLDGPAIIEYHEDGRIKCEKYYSYGKFEYIKE